MKSSIKCPKLKEHFVFKAPSMNLEFVEDGTKTEIRAIKLPKKSKLEKEPRF